MGPAAAPILAAALFAAATAFFEARLARKGRPPPEPRGLALMRRFYEAHNGQDLRALGELLAADFQLVLTGGPYAAGALDRREALEFLRAGWSRSGGTHRLEPGDLFADGSRGAALVTAKGERADLGLALEAEAVHLFRFRRGRLVELTSLAVSPDAFARFWRQDAGTPIRHPRSE